MNGAHRPQRRRHAPAALAASAAAIMAAVAGCGQKGPLYLPDHAPQTVPATAPAAAPAGTPADDPNSRRRTPAPPDPAAAK